MSTDEIHFLDTPGVVFNHMRSLFIALAALAERDAAAPAPWRSLMRHDGTMPDGMFLAGIGTLPGRQIRYYLPMSAWNQCSFMQTRGVAPEWDGGSSSDLVDRLNHLIEDLT